MAKTTKTTTTNWLLATYKISSTFLSKVPRLLPFGGHYRIQCLGKFPHVLVTCFDSLILIMI
jgi:hypothetical protein